MDTQDKDEFIEFAKHWSEHKPVHGEKEIRLVTKNGDVRLAALTANSILHLEKPATMIKLSTDQKNSVFRIRFMRTTRGGGGLSSRSPMNCGLPLSRFLGISICSFSIPKASVLSRIQKKILERYLVSVDREHQIINQMLDLSVLDSGKLQLNYSTFQLEPLVKSLLDTGGYPAQRIGYWGLLPGWNTRDRS